MVCYETREEAERAVQLMGGTYIDGKPIQVTYDDFEECLEDGHFKVNVQGVSPYTDDAEVEAHMGKVGTVTSFKTEMDWKFGEVRFEDAEDAWQARVQLDGTTFMGRRIRAELDCSTESLSTVLVHGIQRRASWHDLKDHFKLFGPIDWTAIHGGPRTARVEFATTEGAQRAVRELNKMPVKGQRMRIYVAYAHDGTGAKMKDNGELEFIPTIVRVQNVEKWTTEEQLHELFSEVGEVLTVTKMDADSLVPPEFLIT